MLPGFAYVKASSVKDAIRLLHAPNSRLLAGGTDLLGCLRDRVFEAGTVVSISSLRELKGLRELSDGSLVIGALTTLSELAVHPVIRQRFTALSQGALAAASPQLRNQGTLGGNLCQRPRCWYFRGDFHCARKGGDTCFAVNGENQLHAILGGETCFIVHPSDTAPALVALGAQVRLVGQQGQRLIPVESFFVLPSEDFTRETRLEEQEFVAEVVIPAPGPGTSSSYRKVRARGAWDFALAGVALALERRDGVVTSARVVLSGVAPVPWRARETEMGLVGKTVDAATASVAAAAATTGATPLTGNAYKVEMVRGVVEEALLALA